MAHLLGQQVLPAAQTETHVEFGELESTLAFDLAEEVPQPREEEDYVGEDDEEKEEPLPFVG